MKTKHIKARIQQCLAIAECSNCPRAKHGCLIIDEVSNVVLVDSYNGGPRGGSDLCGDASCLRSDMQIPSGERCEIGCTHAEFGAITNAARLGIKLDMGTAFITGEPCLMCAKALHHAGIKKIFIIKDGYNGKNGIAYLRKANITITFLDKEGNLINFCKDSDCKMCEHKTKISNQLTGDFE